MELEFVYSGTFNFYKVFSVRMKKDHQKDASYLKNEKKSSHSKRYNKDIENGVIKNEKYKKSLTTKIKFLTFIFVYGKGYILL